MTTITQAQELPRKLMSAILDGDDVSLRALKRKGVLNPGNHHLSKKLYERKWGRGTFPVNSQSFGR
jgi:hypothetical protein